MSFTEKNFQTLFTKWAKENPPDDTEVYELKVSKGISIPFDAVKEHQEKALLQAVNKGLYHKISDSPIYTGMKTRFTKPKPFDALHLRASMAYIVILFYKPRKKKEMIFISIHEWLELKKNAVKKSVREKELKEVADFIVKL